MQPPLARRNASIFTDSLRWVRGAYDYRVLIAKRDQLAYPLIDVEKARLCELTQLFGHDLNGDELPWSQREHHRARIWLPARFGDAEGQASDISGDGLFVYTRTALPEGARTVVRISGRPAVPVPRSDFHEEWQFAAEVVRVELAGMALRFVGIPVVLRIHGSGPRRPLRRAA